MSSEISGDLALAYLAGLFDGEGCVSVTSHVKGEKKYYTKTLVFSNDSRDLCEQFQNHLGTGRIYQTRTEEKHGRSHYQWRANGKDAIQAAKILVQWCRLKAQQMREKILS